MKKSPQQLRSRQWFDDPEDPGMTALYLERYLNFGLTMDELQSTRPVIGIAQTGSDLAPCNRHHIELAQRVKDGIREAGGIPLEFPVHPIQETGRRPTAALDRNLQCLSLIEVLHGYPLDGVVLMTGCDKTTPALLMGAASVDLPSIALSVGPMLNGNYQGRCVGSGTVIWEARQKLAKGEIDYKQFMQMAAGSAPSAGHCNTMGTALSMNCVTEALGMSLPGSASIPAPYRERAQMAYYTGRRIVDMIWEDLKPSDILTRQAFQNAIVVSAAIGASTNVPIHLAAIAKHANVELPLADWQDCGGEIPQIVNCQPVGEYLSEEFHQAGGVPATLYELLKQDLLHPDAITVSGLTLANNCSDSATYDQRVIRPVDQPVRKNAGLMLMHGNLFDSAVMKVSAIDDSFRKRYLSTEGDENAFEGRAIVFEGPEDYHANINNPELEIDEHSILIMRGAGPKGYPGSAEVVNMQAPDRLLKQGIDALPTIGDGRQSGTSAAPSILNASPEAADGGNLAIVQTGDRLRIDLNQGRVTLKVSDEEIALRHKNTRFQSPANQTWWQEIYRDNVNNLDQGAVFEGMTKYQKIASDKPRHSH